MKRCLPISNDSTSVYVTTSAVMKHLKQMQHATFIGLILLLLCMSSTAQLSSEEAAYIKVVTERSAKIVQTLSITDSAQYYNVLHTLVTQYTSINSIHEQNKLAVESVKKENATADVSANKLKELDAKKLQQLNQLHLSFLQQLQLQLKEEQIEKVKDGMTYRVFPITYTAYLDMIPTLTSEQQQKIYDWLKEARELAMDAESSDAKHAVFGKYKGRINNYLSAQGYDLTKEREEWQKRIKAKTTTANKN